MIIQCDQCDAKFRLDESTIKGIGVKVRCTKCQNVFVVSPPKVEEEIEAAVVEAAPSEPSPPEEDQDSSGLNAADFGLSEDEGDGSGTIEFGNSAPDSTEPSATDEAEKVFSEMDFDTGGEAGDPGEGDSLGEDDFGMSTLGETPEEEVKEEIVEETKEEAPSPFEDLDLGDSGESAADELFNEDVSDKEPEDIDFGLSEEAIGGDIESGGEEPVAEEPVEEPAEEPAEEPPMEVASSLPADLDMTLGEEAEEEAAAEEIEQAEEPDISFTAKDAGEETTEVAAKEKKPGGKKKFAIIGIAVVIIIAVGLYFGLGGMTKPAAPAKADFKIEGLKGFFADNEHLGKLFAVEGKVRNVSSTPKEVVGVKVTIFDKRGKPISVKTVSLARIISNEELKTLPKVDLDRHFKDLSRGSIPPKGTTPLMAVFTEVSKEMAEFEVTIVP